MYDGVKSREPLPKSTGHKADACWCCVIRRSILFSRTGVDGRHKHMTRFAKWIVTSHIADVLAEVRHTKYNTVFGRTCRCRNSWRFSQRHYYTLLRRYWGGIQKVRSSSTTWVAPTTGRQMVAVASMVWAGVSSTMERPCWTTRRWMEAVYVSVKCMCRLVLVDGALLIPPAW